VADWVIGDVHGCWETCSGCSSGSAGAERDRLWLIGDLVNRGPDRSRCCAGRRGSRSSTPCSATTTSTSSPGPPASRSAARGPARRGPAAPDREPCSSGCAGGPSSAASKARCSCTPGCCRHGAATRRSPSPTLPAAGCRSCCRCSPQARPKWSAEAPATSGWRQRSPSSPGSGVRGDGSPKLGFTAAPESIPEGCRPWYQGSRTAAAGARVIFGHWAMMASA